MSMDVKLMQIGGSQRALEAELLVEEAESRAH